MADRRILVAKNVAALAVCRLCKKPNPPEDLSPGAVCKNCWAKEGAPRGWVLIPPGMALVPMQVVNRANVGIALVGELKPHQGERGVEEPVVLTLRRLLEERERLVAEVEDDHSLPPRCCYCGATWQSEDGADGPIWQGGEIQNPGNIVRLADPATLPTVWHCDNRAACVQRVNEQLNARHAHAQHSERIN